LLLPLLGQYKYKETRTSVSMILFY
ncbi:hypothetical protein SNEBB_007677, partial [Seison nebaliae]